MSTARSRRGLALLETLLALLLFAMAASFSLSAARSVGTALETQRLDAIAADLAWSRLAELEAGAVTLGELRDEGTALAQVGSGPWDEDGERGWRLDVQVSRSAITGLSLVEIVVWREAPDGTIDGPPVRAAARRLIALREGETEFETDELLRGLPQEPSP